MPQRIQRKRSKGWRTPLCTCGCGQPAIYVGRPSLWGNRYEVGRCVDPLLGWRVSSRWRPDGIGPCWPTKMQAVEDAVRRYRRWVMGRSPAFWEPLAGHDLMCWCPIEDGNGNRVPCHADVLLVLANGGDPA